MEDWGRIESEEESGTAWWAPASPRFAPDSLAWSEDEEEWSPAGEGAQGKSKRGGKDAGSKPIKSYARKDRENSGKKDRGRVEAPSHTEIGERRVGKECRL